MKALSKNGSDERASTFIEIQVAFVLFGISLFGFGSHLSSLTQQKKKLQSVQEKQLTILVPFSACQNKKAKLPKCEFEVEMVNVEKGEQSLRSLIRRVLRRKP